MFAVIDEAEREAGIGLVLREILDDPDAGFRSDAVLYQDFLVRCRIRRVGGQPLSLSAFRRRLAVAQGMRTMLREAMALVENDVTTIPEVVKTLFAS